MNGAESVVRTAAEIGLDTCFANPGTTEVHILGAMNETPQIRPVLGLFEGVCTGAADGFARMARRPALTLMHLGAGLANGVANLHNARKAESPVVNVIGTHATRHMNHESLLSSDVPGLAAIVSTFVRETRVSEDAAVDLVEAKNAAVERRGVSTLILPTDVQWNDVPGHPRRLPALWPSSFESRLVESAAEVLRREGPRGALLIGADGLLQEGLLAAGRIQAATGCRLFSKRQPARIESGPGIPVVERLGYFPEASAAQLANTAAVVVAGTEEPVAIFAYRGGPTHVVPPGSEVLQMSRPIDDVIGSLEALADFLDAPPASDAVSALAARRELADRPANIGMSALIASLLPENSIYVDEAITSAPDVFEHAVGATTFTYLGLTGGSIGIGGPLAVGAAVAEPDRPVINVQGDGSAMYTLQALWTQAREGLDVTTVICANNRYNILTVEQKRAGIEEVSPAVDSLMDLTSPILDWVQISEGFGVPATQTIPDGLAAEMARAVAEPGPHLIQLNLDRP